MRELRHPEIDHTFIVRDISLSEIEIDGVRLHKKDCDWMVMMANHSGEQTATLNNLTLPILQFIMSKTQNITNKK